MYMLDIKNFSLWKHVYNVIGLYGFLEVEKGVKFS